MPRKAKFTAALVGCGRIGQTLEQDPLRGKPCTHAGALSALGKVQLVAGADPDPEQATQFGRAFGVDDLYPDHTTLLQNHSVDILAVASPTDTHCRIVCDAAASGRVRGIYCEKPISRTVEEADLMIEACEKAGVALVIGHERRFGSHFKLARKLIADGSLGEIRTVIGQALSADPGKLPRELAGGGPLLHDGTHLTDLLGFFAGPAEWVIGNAQRSHGPRNVEHTASAMVGFRNGARGFIEGGGRRKYFAFDMEIQGERGILKIGNSPPSLMLTAPSERWSGFSELRETDFPAYKPNNGFVAAFEALLAEITIGTPSGSSGHDGRAALELILAVYESSARGGRRVRLGS
jgi:predicted dehydrogenase